METFPDKWYIIINIKTSYINICVVKSMNVKFEESLNRNIFKNIKNISIRYNGIRKLIKMMNLLFNYS